MRINNRGKENSEVDLQRWKDGIALLPRVLWGRRVIKVGDKWLSESGAPSLQSYCQLRAKRFFVGNAKNKL